MPITDHFEYSDIGKRKTNQDDCLVYTVEGYTVLAVADGMGGHRGGETASEMAISKALKALIELAKSKTSLTLKDIILQMFANADQAIREFTDQNPSYRGMGTTLCCVLIKDGHFAWGNIGDSRIYQFTQGYMYQLTQDHTLLQDYINEYGDQDLPDFILQKSHQLTRVLDGNGHEIDLYPFGEESYKLNEGEAFLLCSDGLIPSKDIDYNDLFAEYLLHFASLEQTAKKLVEHAEDNHSSDNITLVLYEYGNLPRLVEKEPAPVGKDKPKPKHGDKPPPVKPVDYHKYYPDPPSPRKRRIRRAIRAAVVLLVLTAIAVTGYRFLPGQRTVDSVTFELEGVIVMFKDGKNRVPVDTITFDTEEITIPLKDFGINVKRRNLNEDKLEFNPLGLKIIKSNSETE